MFTYYISYFYSLFFLQTDVCQLSHQRMCLCLLSAPVFLHSTEDDILTEICGGDQDAGIETGTKEFVLARLQGVGYGNPNAGGITDPAVVCDAAKTTAFCRRQALCQNNVGAEAKCSALRSLAGTTCDADCSDAPRQMKSLGLGWFGVWITTFWVAAEWMNQNGRR